MTDLFLSVDGTGTCQKVDIPRFPFQIFIRIACSSVKIKLHAFISPLLLFVLQAGKWNSYNSGNAYSNTVSVLFKTQWRRNTTASSPVALGTREMGLIELFLSWTRLIIP